MYRVWSLRAAVLLAGLTILGPVAFAQTGQNPTVQLAARAAGDETTTEHEATRALVPKPLAAGLGELGSSEEHAIENARSFADDATRIFDLIAPTLEAPARGRVVAEAGPAAGPAPSATAMGIQSDMIDLATDWLDRAARQYSNVIVRQLAVGDRTAATGSDAGVAATGRVLPARRAQVGGGTDKDLFEAFQDSLRRWFDRANKDYQGVIVRHLSEPSPTGTALNRSSPPPAAGQVEVRRPPARIAEQEKAPAAAPPRLPAPSSEAASIQDQVTTWLQRANKDYQGVIVKRLQDVSAAKQPETTVAAGPRSQLAEGGRAPPPMLPLSASGDSSRSEAERLAEIERGKRAEAARLAAVGKEEDERRRAAAEEVRRAGEAAQRAEAARRAAEQARAGTSEASGKSEAVKGLEPDPRSIEEIRRTAAAEAAARAEIARRAEQERLRAGEEARRVAALGAAAAAQVRQAAEEERRRTAAAQRAAEEQQRRDEGLARRRLAAEQAQAEAARRAEEQARRAAAASDAAAAAAERRSAARVSQPRRSVSSERKAAPVAATRRTVAKAESRVRSPRRLARGPARAETPRAAPRVTVAARPALKAKARVNTLRQCGSRRAGVTAVPPVVVVELKGGVYHSVFEREYDRRRIVMAYNAAVADAASTGCAAVARRP